MSRSVSQPLVEAGQRRTAAPGDPVPQALRGAAEGGQRPVGVQHDDAEDREQDEPGDAEQGGMDEPGAGRRAGQHGGQREDGQRQQAADAEQGEGGQAAHGGVGVEPGGGEHAELDGGAGRVAAGQAVGDRVAGQPGGDDGEPAPGAQRQPLQGEVAGEGGQFGGQRDAEPDRAQRGQARPRTQHRSELRQHKVDSHAGHGHDQGPLDHGLPRQRALLRRVDGSGLRRDRSRLPGTDGPLSAPWECPRGVTSYSAVSNHVINSEQDKGHDY